MKTKVKDKVMIILDELVLLREVIRRDVSWCHGADTCQLRVNTTEV